MVNPALTMVDSAGASRIGPKSRLLICIYRLTKKLQTQALKMLKYVYILCLFFVIDLMPCFFEGPSSWWAFAILSNFELFILSFLFMCYVPYDKTYLKSFLLFLSAWFFHQLVYVVLSVFGLVFVDIPSYLCGFLFFAFGLIYILTRIFDRPSYPINDTDIFVVYKRPRKRNRPIRDALDLVLSLFGKEGGGKFIICRGHAYRFRHGVISRQSNIHDPESVNYLTVRLRTAKDKDVEYLQSVIGTKWSLFKNCYLIFLPIERDYAHKKCKSI